MANSKVLPGILFALLASFVGFIAGGMWGGAVAGKSSGLAGGATVFFYGLAGLVIVLAVSVVLVLKLSPSHLWKSVIVAAMVAAFAAGWIIYRVVTMQPQSGSSLSSPPPAVQEKLPSNVLCHHAT